MNDDMVVRETLGLNPLSLSERRLIYEMLRYVRREDFKGALTGAYFLCAALDLYLKLDQSKGKRRELARLRKKVGLQLGGLDVRVPKRRKKGTPKNRKGADRCA